MNKTIAYVQQLLVATSLFGCASCHTNHPPKSEAPNPAPLSGTFVSGNDTLIFNGDEKSISWHLAESVENIGVQGNGTYVFLFNGAAWRYDAAEQFKIFTSENKEATFSISLPGSCNDSTISISHVDPSAKEKVFKKQP